jgi:hypothetical protein
MPSLPNCTALAPLLVLGALHAQSITLTPRVDFGTAQEYGQQAVCADFDHDGNLDIAVTMEGYGQGKLEVLFGDGQADFGSSNEYTNYVAWGLCSGDFNGDGWLDLAATSRGWAQHGVHIWGNNHGPFGAQGTISTLGSPPAGACTGDFDGDGVLDIAAISEGGGYAVDWFSGNGDFTFSSFHYVPNTNGLVGTRIYAGQFNGDSHLDLVAIHNQGAMVLLNDSQGSGNFNSSNGITITETIGSAAVADLNGDGMDDIVTAGANLRVWRGLGNGQFSLAGTYPTTGGNDIKLVDFNLDGRRDALVVGYGGAQIFFGAAGGVFGASQMVPAGIYPKACVVGDWDGDGYPDLGILCQNTAGLSSYVSIYLQTPPSVAASATPFGTGCGTPALSLVADTTRPPRLGQTARATMNSAPSQVAGMALGFSNQVANGNPLPMSLASFGMPGCSQYVSTEFASFGLTPLGASSLQYSFAIPNLSPLLGFSLHLQGYAHAPGANAIEAVVSNGLTWTIGNH